MFRAKETKLMPFLIQDHGIYYGNGIERSFPSPKSQVSKSDKKVTKDSIIEDENLLLEYLKIIKKIETLEQKKVKLAEKINSNPEFQKIFNELSKENSSAKSK